MLLDELADQYRLHLAVVTIAEEVERVSGKPVDVQPTPGLDVRARLRMARSGMPHHVVLFSPMERPHLSHLLAHELGRILRTFETPSEERRIPVSTAEKLRRARGEIRPEAQSVPTASRDRIVDTWIHGLVTQVTSQPIDVLVERWLSEQYPGLREQQVRSLRTETGAIIASISPEIEGATAPGVFRRSKAMNYAYLKHIGEIMGRSFEHHFRGDPEVVALGQRLSDVFGSGVFSDQDVVARWADMLGISDWFTWVGFEDVPASYRTG
jgi:hypothetical protein